MANIIRPEDLDHIDEDAQTLSRLAERAERKVLNRYRETDAHDNGQDLILDEYYGREIRLDGYVEQEDSEQIDLERSDDRLIEALRETITRIVEFWARKPDEAEHVSRLDQGERRVDFRDKGLPTSAFSPLRPFDERRVWH